MPFLTRNENQSQVKYAAPASPMIAITGPPPAIAITPEPAATAAARAPLRLATTLLRWTSEEAIPRRLHHEMPPVKPRLAGHSRCGRRDTPAITVGGSTAPSGSRVASRLQM